MSCGHSKTEEKSINQEITPYNNLTTEPDSILTTDNVINDSKRVVERYLPEEKQITKFDTIISNKNLKISISSSHLDSYVTNEYESEGIKYIDKYRDSEKHLIIELSNEVIIDTLFKKDDFVEYAGQDFLKIADFHGYWFNKIENETIELFGVLSKPETDWSFAFYHYLNLKSKKFKIKEDLDEEI